MFKKIILPVLVIIIFSCHRGNKESPGASPDALNNELFVIDPNTFGSEEITLSEIAEDVSYIPFDNSEPFGEVLKMIMTEKDIYIQDFEAGFLKYDRSGQFKCKIGSKGRGPGEYRTALLPMTVDGRTGKVYLLDQSNIKVYSESGRFVRDIGLERIGWMEGVEIFNSKLFITYHLDSNAWIITDTLGNIISKKANSIPIKTDYSFNGTVYKFNNNIYCFNAFNDTIFRISEDLVDSPAYLFAKGDFRFPNEKIETLGDRFIPTRGLETNKYIILFYSYFKEYKYALINKKTWKVRNGESVINDINAGPDFYPRYYFYDSISQTEYLFNINSSLRKYIESDKFRSKTYKSREKRRELESLASKLELTDNPVLVMVKLKK